MKRMKKLLAGLLAVVMLLSMAACGNKESGAPADSKDPATEGIAGKDTLVIAQGADPKSLDPYGTTDTPAIRVANCIYESLVTLDDDGNIQPCLAESWEVVDDTTYLFHLRKGVKFHNGEELKASDVAFSFSKIAESPHAESIRATIDFENSKAINDYTFEMKMSEPFGAILNHMAHAVMAIVNEKAYTEAGDQVSQNPCGTGPYKFVSWATGDRIDLVANEEYWGDAPLIKNVTWRAIPEASTRTVEVEAGTSDIVIDAPANEIDRLESNPKVNVLRHAASSVDFIAFNNTMAPFDNVKVRQAINMAINKEAIQKVVFHNTGVIAAAPMSSSVWAFNDQLEPSTYDPEAAKELLAEAGYPDGFEMTITCDESQQRHDIAEMVQEMLSPLGITVEIRPMERGAYIDKVIAGELECFSLGWTSDTGDPDYALYASFHSSQHGAAGNMSFYTNEEVDELLQTGRTSTDPEVRKEAYLKAQEIIWEEVPCIFLHCQENLFAYNADLQGFDVDFGGELKLTQMHF